MGAEVKEKRKNQVDVLFGARVTMWMMMPLSKVWKTKIGVYFGVIQSLPERQMLRVKDSFPQLDILFLSMASHDSWGKPERKREEKRKVN